MANGKRPPKPPSLLSIPGGKAPTSRTSKSHKGRKVTLQVWQRMEEYWLKIDRSPSALARKFGVSEHTALRIVHRGLPTLNRKPLAELAAEYDQVAQNRSAREMEAQMKAEADEFGRTKRSNLQAAKNVKGIIALVQNELILRYNQQGARPLEKETLDKGLPKLVALAKSMSQALRDLGEYEMKWLHGAKPEDEGVGDTPFGNLTDEQIKLVAETGRLPEGIDIETFYKGLGMAPPSR